MSFQIGGDDLDTSRSQFASAAAARRQKVQDAKTANANLPIDKVRKACLARGVCGIKSIGSTFRRYDDNGDKHLTPDELRDCLQDYKVTLTEEEFVDLVDSFDKDDDGRINYDEFLLALRGPMSKARVSIIEKAFQTMDKDGSGVITIEDIEQVYDHRKHPKFQTGVMTKKQVLEEFINSFETDKDAKVTMGEFLEYYAGVSASIDNDAYFDLMMRNAWKI